MIVCLCRSVSDRKIMELVESGAESIDALRNLCGVGRGCGKCVHFVMDLLEERGLLSEKSCGRKSLHSQRAKEHHYGRYCK